jgi:hypothetical protein
MFRLSLLTRPLVWILTVITLSSCLHIFVDKYPATEKINVQVNDKVQKVFDSYKLSQYRVITVVSQKGKDVVEKKNNNLVFNYRLPFELLDKPEKLLYEEYFQQVRHLYKTRTDFIDEYYNYFLLIRDLADIHLYGYEKERTLFPSREVDLFVFTFIKQAKLRDVDVDRLFKAQEILLKYWQEKTYISPSERTPMRRQIVNAMKAYQESQNLTLKDVMSEVALRNFKYAED